MIQGQGQDQDAQSDDKAAPPKPMANLRAACQHVYDKYLSKPYSNDPPFNKNQWDREFKGDNDEVVFRPNHGLAHTLRVAAYAPVVAEYFKKFSPEKEKYDFSADQLEKIQIALLFAVVGRKNEWGFSDNKVEYMKFREDCVTAFKDWCKENPGKFTDEEIEQYGKSVLNFGADDMKDPISMMMKACHKLDLLRCFQDDRTESAMSHIAHEIGEDNVKELLLYADQCIRATGDRIMDGHMLGTGGKKYDPTVFPRASKDPNVCLDLFAQVTPPKPQIKIENKSEPQAVSWKPTANDTLVQNILAQQKPSQAQPAKTEPLSARDYKTIAASLMSEVNAKQVLTDMSALMNKNDISLSDKGKLLHNSGLLLVRLLAAETPPESFKDLVNYLSAPDDQKKNFEDKPIVAAYKGLVDAAKQHPELNGILKDFENKNVEFAKAVKKNEQTFEASKDALRGTGPSVDIDGFINDKLAKEKVKPAQMEKYAEQLAQALKAQNIEALLNVQMKDLYEGQWSKPGKGESAANLNIVLQQTAKIVRDDVLNGKSKEHQIALIDFYAQVMQKSFQNKDYSTAYALYVAFNDSDVTRLPHIADHMAKNKKFKALYNKMHHTFDAQGNMKNYRALLAEQHGNVIPIFSILLKDMEFGSQVAKVDSQNKTANVGQFEIAAKSLDAFSAYRTAALTSKAPESTMDLSHFKRPYMGEKEAYAASKRLQKPEAFDLTAKKDEANAKIQADGLDGIDSINARFDAVNSVLDKDLNLPVNLVVQANGKTFENQKAYPLLIKELQALANEAIQAKGKAKSPFGKKQCDLVLEKIMINVQAIERHAENHQALKGAQKQLNALKASLEGAGIKPKTEQALKGEIAKQKFKLGRADSYVKDIKSAAGITEVERVPFGPLAKNEATKQYEDLMKGMLAGKDFTHKTEMIDGVGQLIITMDGKDYNMSKIMKDVNLNHLQFTDAEKQAYVQMMTADGTHHFAPHKPNPLKPKDPDKVQGKADIEALDASFLQRDPKLSEISQAERLALNVYSTGFFRDANGFMRGGIPSETNMKKPGFLKELICHTGMAVSGLQGISTEVPIATFRGEKQLPKPVLDARIAAAESGGVTVEAGFVSTSQDKPDVDFGFKHEEFDESVAIVYTNLTGKDIHGLSAFPHEREFLIPPTQMQWQAHATAKGGHLFLASPVNTPLGLSPEARKMFTPDVIAAAPNPDPAAVVPPIAPPPPQAADAPPPAAPLSLSADLEALGLKASQVANIIPPPPIPSRENKPPLQPKAEAAKQEGPEKPAISKKPMLKKTKGVVGLPKFPPSPPPGPPTAAKQDEIVVAQPVIAQETQVQAPGPIANAKDLVELADMTATNDLAELENDLAELDAISARTFAEMEKIAKELEQIAKVEQASATVEPVQAEISTEEEEAKKLATRRRYILQEVNSTEDTYLREMKVVLDKKDVLLNQIKNDKKFSKEEKQTIGELIQTLEHIYKVQSEMRNEFVALAKALEEGDSVKAAASSKTIAGLTKLSAQYHGQYAAVYDGKFSSMLNKDKLNKSFVKLSEVLGGWKLDSKLITPVQRYPRYELLFKELEKSTEPSFSLYSMFQNLSTLFKVASDTVNNIPKFRAFNAIMKAEKLKGKEIEAYSKLVEDFEKNPNDANLKAQIAAWDKKHPRIGEASALYAEILPLMHKPTVTDKGREIPKQQPLPEKVPPVLYLKPSVRSPEEKAQAEKIVQARLSTLESIFDQLKDNASEDGKWKLRLLHEYLVKNLKDNTLSATVDRLKGELPSYVRSIKGSDELDQFLDSLSKELKDPLKVDLKPKEVVIDKEAQAARDRVIADLLGTFTYANTKQDEDMILKPLKKYVNEALKNNITPQGVRNLWKQMPSHVQGSQEIKAKFDGLVANYEMVLADMKTGVELSDKQKKRP